MGKPRGGGQTGGRVCDDKGGGRQQGGFGGGGAKGWGGVAVGQCTSTGDIVWLRGVPVEGTGLKLGFRGERSIRYGTVRMYLQVHVVEGSAECIGPNKPHR